MLAVKLTAANKLDRAQVGVLAQGIQATTGQTVKLAFVDQGYSGNQPVAEAAKRGIRLEVVKHHKAKQGFELLPRRWVGEHSFAWAARFSRAARDYERLASILAGSHWLAFVSLMLKTLFARTVLA
jgi:transposase